VNLGDYLQRLELQIETAVRSFLSIPVPTKRERLRKSVEIKKVIEDVQGIIPVEAPKLVKIEYNNGARTALNKVPDLRFFTPDVANFSKINEETVNLLADNLQHSLLEATNVVGRRSDDVLRRHSLNAATTHVLRTVPVEHRGVGNPLRVKLEREGITGFVDKAGRRWKLSTYSDMVIRTISGEANNRAVANAVLGRGLDLVRVDKHKHPTDICTPFDGKVFSLTGRVPGYPVLTVFPPFHPNCKHTILPARENFTDVNAMEVVAA
jgi:hypothetical protein